MALNAYIQFNFNGEEINGEPLTQTMAGEDVSTHVEAVAFYQELNTEVSAEGVQSGRLIMSPLTIVKVPDRTTPMFLHALSNNHSVDAVIKLYKYSAQGVVQLQQVITTTNGRIATFRSEMLNSVFSESAATPVLERISFTYHTMNTLNVPYGVESEINWNSVV